MVRQPVVSDACTGGGVAAHAHARALGSLAASLGCFLWSGSNFVQTRGHRGYQGHTPYPCGLLRNPLEKKGVQGLQQNKCGQALCPITRFLHGAAGLAAVLARAHAFLWQVACIDGAHPKSSLLTCAATSANSWSWTRRSPYARRNRSARRHG